MGTQLLSMRLTTTHAVADCKNGSRTACLPVSVLLDDVTLQIFSHQRWNELLHHLNLAALRQMSSVCLTLSIVLMQPSPVSLQEDEGSVAVVLATPPRSTESLS